jgi:hypothetical protein
VICFVSRRMGFVSDVIWFNHKSGIRCEDACGALFRNGSCSLTGSRVSNGSDPMSNPSRRETA